MKFSPPALVEGALALAVVCFTAVLSIPWREQPLLAGPGGKRAAVPALTEQVRPSPVRADPETVVTLFVPRAAARPAAKPSAEKPAAPVLEKKPTEAPWLAYLGFSSGAEGKPTYYFKDTRSGRVIKVTQGDTASDWTLAGITQDRMILRNKDDLFAVKR